MIQKYKLGTYLAVDDGADCPGKKPVANRNDSRPVGGLELVSGF